MLGLFLLACAVQIQSALAWGQGSWQLSEWLINYAGGFVRRGLPGSLLWGLSRLSGIQANHLAIVAGICCFVWLTGWLLARATREFPPVLVLSCLVMGIPAYQDSIVRKDCLGMLFLLAVCTVAKWNMPRWRILVGLNVVAIIAILTHEAFAFYGLGVMLIFTRPGQSQGSFRLHALRMLELAPAILCFLSTLVFHGNPTVAACVNDSWIPLWQLTDPGNAATTQPAAAIEALGWTTGRGLSLGIDLLTSGFYQPAAWAMVYGTTFGLMVLFSGRGGGSALMEVKSRVVAILCVQLLGLSPLFLLGYDYGRWLFFWTTSTIILHALGFRAPEVAERLVARMFMLCRAGEWLPRVPVRDWYLLLFGVPVCWNIGAFTVASPLGRLLSYFPYCY